MEKLGLKAIVAANLQRFGGPKERFKVWSTWEWEHWRKVNGVNRLIDSWENGNLCTDQGLTDLLGVHFSGDTRKTAWFIAIFENDHTPAAGNTYAIPAYYECTAYDEANRPQWQEDGAAAKAITNSAAKASFTFNATKTIYGGALVGGGTDANTKGDVVGGGVLFCMAAFVSGPKSVVNTDVLKVSVSLSVADN